MTAILYPSIRGYLHGEEVNKRFIRTNEAANVFDMSIESIEEHATAAGAVYKLSRIILIHQKRLEEYMKHLYKVPSSGKYVEQKYARIGEASKIYSIGHHRIIEMARAAGAVYKINEGIGGTVLISLDLFDAYMEQFREVPVPLKNPLWKMEDKKSGGINDNII